MGNQPSLPQQQQQQQQQQQNSSSCDISEMTMEDNDQLHHLKPLVKQLSDCTTASSVQDLLSSSTSQKSPGRRQQKQQQRPTIFDLVAKHTSTTPAALNNNNKCKPQGGDGVNVASKEVVNPWKKSNRSMQDQANHNLHVICMVLAYARALEQTLKTNTILEPIAAKEVVAMGLTLNLKPKSRRPYPAE
jgi:hypothetical protein